MAVCKEAAACTQHLSEPCCCADTVPVHHHCHSVEEVPHVTSDFLHPEVLWKSDNTVYLSYVLHWIHSSLCTMQMGTLKMPSSLPPPPHPSSPPSIGAPSWSAEFLSDMTTAGPHGRLSTNGQVHQHAIQHPVSPLPQPLGPSTIKQKAQENATRVCKTFIPWVVRLLNPP